MERRRRARPGRLPAPIAMPPPLGPSDAHRRATGAAADESEDLREIDEIEAHARYIGRGRRGLRNKSTSRPFAVMTADV